MSLETRLAAAADPIFRAKVLHASWTAASQVLGEDPASLPGTLAEQAAAYADRQHLAALVIAQPDNTLQAFVLGVLSQDTVTDASSDADIAFMVSAVFNDIAAAQSGRYGV